MRNIVISLIERNPNLCWMVVWWQGLLTDWKLKIVADASRKGVE